MMNTNNRKALYDQKMVQIEEELTPFGFIDNGNDEPDYEVNSGDLWLSDKYQKNLKDFLKEKIL